MTDSAMEENMTASPIMGNATELNATEEILPPPPGLAPISGMPELRVPLAPQDFTPLGESKEVASGVLPPPMPSIKLPSVSLRFEIKNVNYDRLDDPVSTSPLMTRVTGFLQGPEFQTIEQNDMSLDDSQEQTNGEVLEEAIVNMVRNLLASVLGLTGQIVEQDSGSPPPSSEEVHETIGGAAVVSFARAAHATSQAQGPGAVALPLVSVTFMPGRSMGSAGTSTIAVVHIVEIPGTQSTRLQAAADDLRNRVLDGSLQRGLATSVQAAFHGTAIIGEIDESVGFVEPYNLLACATHVEKIVDGFSKAYTRHQVPHALYHACENYEQKASFSHDSVIDRKDKEKCKKATKKFMKMWQYGKGRVDYGRFCLQMCELKHGQDAIRCDSFKYIAKL